MLHQQLIHDCSATPATLQHADIARRIPHQGSMCLLDRVTAWDNEHIFCEAVSHRSVNNPLRAYGRLGAACGVEYAAQAMAVHGALIAETAQGSKAACSPTRGYLISVRNVRLHVKRLDDVKGALSIQAERLSGDSATILYGFSVHSAPALDAPPLPLLSGRAIVVLDSTLAALPAFSGAP